MMLPRLTADGGDARPQPVDLLPYLPDTQCVHKQMRSVSGWLPGPAYLLCTPKHPRNAAHPLLTVEMQRAAAGRTSFYLPDTHTRTQADAAQFQDGCPALPISHALPKHPPGMMLPHPLLTAEMQRPRLVDLLPIFDTHTRAQADVCRFRYAWPCSISLCTPGHPRNAAAPHPPLGFAEMQAVYGLTFPSPIHTHAKQMCLVFRMQPPGPAHLLCTPKHPRNAAAPSTAGR
jgi:hypothetical protein